MRYKLIRESSRVNNIHQKMCEDLGYQRCRRTLLKDIHKLGFRWRKLKSNRKILLERPPIRILRIEFLRKICDFRQEGRAIIYMGESYIHSSDTHQRGWSDESNDGLKKPVSKCRAKCMHKIEIKLQYRELS